jgi:hypothetical protein
MMNKMQKIRRPAALRCVLFGLLLVLPACSRPSSSPFMSPAAEQEPQTTEYTVTNTSYIVPEMSEVIERSPWVVIATVEPTQITYNWYEQEQRLEGDSTLWYQNMRVYRIHVESYLKGSGEMMIYMGWAEGDTIMAKTQEELDVKIGADIPGAPPLEAGKRYLLFLSEHAFDYRPEELDLAVFYEGSTALRTFEITASGETIPVLISALSDIKYPGWTLDEFILYINRPELIPTRTPLPIQEQSEPYPFETTPTLDPLAPYPFPMGTPLPYGAYPEP